VGLICRRGDVYACVERVAAQYAALRDGDFPVLYRTGGMGAPLVANALAVRCLHRADDFHHLSLRDMAVDSVEVTGFYLVQ
jgi:hypothetical protein